MRRLLLCALGLALAWPTLAHAHAELIASNPANGAVLDVLPPQLELNYTEGLQYVEIDINNDQGVRFDHVPPTIDPREPTRATQALHGGPPGVYTVQWEVLSVDGHTTRGAIYFIVGTGKPDRATLLQTLLGEELSRFNHPLEPFARTALLVALMLIVGIALMWRLLLPEPLRNQLEPSSRRWVIGAAITGIIAALLLVYCQLSTATERDDVFPRLLIETALGRIGLVRVVGFGVVITSVMVLRRNWWRFVVGIGLGLQASMSWFSHTAARDDIAWLLIADFGHLIAGAIWAGGLLVVGYAAWRTDSATLARLIRRFSPIALGAVILAAGCGILLAVIHVQTPPALTSTLYGWAVVAKSVFLGAALLLAFGHRFWFLPRLERPEAATTIRPLRHSLMLECGLVLALFIVSGVLTATVPAGVAYTAAQQRQPHRQTATIGDIVVALEIVPLHQGTNIFDVRFSRNGRELSADSVADVRFALRRMEDNLLLPQLKAEVIEPGLYSTLGDITLAGEWTLRVQADIDGAFKATTFTLNIPAQHHHE